MTDHVVSFTATKDGFVARCECGWHHRWLPWSRISEVDYSAILAIGLEHARQGDPLPRRPRAI